MFEIKIRDTGELLADKIMTEIEAKEMVVRWEAMDNIHDNYIEDYYEITGEEDDDEYTCPTCSGSGEGCVEDWACSNCGGKGTIYMLED